MALVNGSTYRLQSRADSRRSLNVYAASGTASSLANVCLWTSDSADICQQWTYKVSGNNKYFVCKSNTSVALDLYTGGTAGDKVHNYNAHVYAPSNTSYIIISDTDSGYIKIRLANYSNKYLTANQGNNGTNTGKDVNAAGNVYWYDGGLTDGSQEWKPVLVGATSPTSEIVVTGMPNIPSIYGTSLTEYFHPTAGMVAGTFYGANNGQANILNKISAFYSRAFKTAPAGIEKYAYSLFGSKTIAPGTDFNNTYHHGVDMVNYDGAPVYTAHAGKLIYASGNRIAIFDATKNVTYLYLHTLISTSFANLVGQNVSVGTKIGTQSNQGLGSTGASHLHFEVKAGQNSTASMPSTNLTTPLPSLSPYNYM